MATLETQARFEKLYEEVKNELKNVLPLSKNVNSSPNYFKSINTLGKCNRKIIGGIIKIFTISLNEYLENCTDQTIKNTIAHELNHARSYLKGGTAPERTAYASGNKLEEYMKGKR